MVEKANRIGDIMAVEIMQLQEKKLNTVWFPNYPPGRFANAAYQFLFAQYLKRKYNCEVILGNSSRSVSEFPWTIFGLADHNIELSKLSINQNVDIVMLGTDRSLAPNSDVEFIVNYFKNSSNNILAVDGYFQYDTNLIVNDTEYKAVFDRYLSLKESNTPFQKIIAGYSNQLKENFSGRYLISMHIRRGDYIEIANQNGGDHPYFYTLNIENSLLKINQFIKENRIANAIIYVATDDKEYCKNYFTTRGIDIITSEDFLSNNKYDSSSDLLVDLAALVSSRLLIASNSSLSILASLLNESAAVFWRQTKEGEIISFDPWATPVLFGLVSGS